ncbi:ABC transporter substrate-binding protein [Marinobacter sp. KMM 10035]|uniref:ABC transporter substrate-binding protein n=1 Tax=Marinobacter sp. KMM 10035 TaxID=3134034 RepID=UPI003977F49C
MNKKIITLLGIITTTLLVSSAVDARPLTIVGFGGAAQNAQKVTMFDPFSAQTKTEVLTDTYNGGLAKIKAMVDSESVTWDVVLLEEPALLQACEEGLIEPMDWTAVGDKDEYLESAVSECGLGHIIWSTALAYNKDALVKEPKNWSDFWDVKKFPGKRGLRKGAKANLEFALMADGVAIKDVYNVLNTPAGIERAFSKLKELEPNIQWWEAGAQPPEWLASGDVVMTSSYSGRISNAIKEGRNFGIVWNGQVYSVDSWAVIKGSENKTQGFEFISFASSEGPASEYPIMMPYGVPNKAAISKLPPEVAEILPSSKSNIAVGLREDTIFWVDHQDELNERFNFLISN